MKTYNAIPESARVKGADELNKFLACAVCLSRCAKQGHWNSTGPNFAGVHATLDKVYEAAEEWADTLAERARALGSAADGHPTQIAKGNLLWIDEFPKDIEPTETYIRATAKLLGNFSKLVRDEINEIQKADPATADDLIKITGAADHLLYLVESHL